MEKQYQKIFWGIFILTFHLNLGPMEIFPGFVGYLMIFSACRSFYEESDLPSFKTAGRYAAVLSALGVLDKLLSFSGFFTWNPLITLWMPLMGVLELLLFYHLLGGSIVRLESSEQKEEAEDLLRTQKILTLLLSAQVVLSYLAFQLFLSPLVLVASAGAILLRIYIMSIVASLRQQEIRASEMPREAP